MYLVVLLISPGEDDLSVLPDHLQLTRVPHHRLSHRWQTQEAWHLGEKDSVPDGPGPRIHEVVVFVIFARSQKQDRILVLFVDYPKQKW